MPETARSAWRGRIVTLDAHDTVIDDGIVYVRDNLIAAVQPAGEGAPEDFDEVSVRRVGGTIYPGLIDLHNHLCYDVLQLWQVPKLYTNRDQWGKHPDYPKLISGPMGMLGKSEGCPEAVARFTECKALLGGVTTSQGIKLFSNAGIGKYYRGLLRNVEISDGADLPAAAAKISDVAAENASEFLESLERASCLLLHLSEGTDKRARDHFLALKLANGEVAITKALAGIHCVALKREDFDLLADHGGSMIFSPLSNLLLYGETADVEAALAAGVTMGIGSDWSPTGSKNLLGELKAAHAYSQANRNVLSPLQIVAMATRNAARILKWSDAVGSIEASKRADFIVVDDADEDPYLHLIRASEADIRLVVIDGVSRYGLPSLMHIGAERELESWRVGTSDRLLDLSIPSTSQFLNHVTLREACDRLTHALADPHATTIRSAAATLKANRHSKTQWFLDLDHEETHESIRPRFKTQYDAPKKIVEMRAAGTAARPMAAQLVPLTLDPITAVDDKTFAERLSTQGNVPKPIKEALIDLYS